MSMFPRKSYWHSPNGILSEDRLVATLINQAKGVVILDGISGCGKSRILRKVELLRDIYTCSYQDIVQLLEHIYNSESKVTVTEYLSQLLSEFPAVAIDDIDLMKRTYMGIVGKAIQKAGSKCLIIVSGNTLEKCADDLVIELCWAHYYTVCR